MVMRTNHHYRIKPQDTPPDGPLEVPHQIYQPMLLVVPPILIYQGASLTPFACKRIMFAQVFTCEDGIRDVASAELAMLLITIIVCRR